MSQWTVLVFSGHSGGHLYPAVAFAESFRKRRPGAKIVLVSSRKAGPFVARMSSGIFDAVHLVREFPFPSGISLNLVRFLLELPQAFLETLKILRTERPDLCVGFGSYVSYPGIVLGSLWKIPCLIHEQNLVPGRATRSLLKHADAVAVSFAPTFENDGLKDRVVTGLPLRSCLREKASERLRLEASVGFGAARPFRILVSGGSQGAQRLNDLVLDALAGLNDEEKRGIAVNHITGERDHERVSKRYEELGIAYRAWPFFETMQDLYAESDMAVTRAGASTLGELALFGLPAVVIPYPHAASHQKANAGYFESCGAVLTAEESAADPAWLAEKIRSLKNDPELRRRMAESLSRLACADAAVRLAGVAENLIEKRNF
ncbi:MAG: UDP-N-acetylglucosamine--N-acetylmuramyl-(pentapeptide) pyrophosphoryl-undecaprenol N-acetylglucosamine transferase [Candidatus Omnitrophota bacterium]